MIHQTSKIGNVDDMLIDKEGRVTALIIGVGGFLGMGEKNICDSLQRRPCEQKNNKWYLVLNTTKDAKRPWVLRTTRPNHVGAY